MIVDHHVHLEEGPYSVRWWNRTAEAMLSFHEIKGQKHTLAWMEELSALMSQRVAKGAFSAKWLDLYRQRAKQLGLREVGIVDHLYRFVECKSYYEQHMHLADDELGRMQRVWLDQVCVCSIYDFIAFINQQKRVWEADGIELKLGIEADYFPGGEEELKSILTEHSWDFVIGSVHFVDGWGFDNPETQERFQRYDLAALYDSFFQLIEKAITCHLFDIIGHPDNIKVFGHRLEQAALLPYYERIAGLLAEHNTATEVNTGLFYRFPAKEMCPALGFLEVLHQHGVSITTSSDAHFPDHLGSFIEEAQERLKQAGFEEIVTFNKRVPTSIKL